MLQLKEVSASFLQVFKSRLDGALSKPVLWQVFLPMAGELEHDGL